MYRTILVPLDGSPTARLALADAAQLASLSGAKLHLLHIVDAMEHMSGFEQPAVYVHEIRPGFLDAGHAMLDAAKAELTQQGLAAETTLIESRGERVSELIANHASGIGADLVVMGTHGRRGIDRLLIGSDAEQVARIAPVPVMLVRERKANARR